MGFSSKRTWGLRAPTVLMQGAGIIPSRRPRHHHRRRRCRRRHRRRRRSHSRLHDIESNFFLFVSPLQPTLPLPSPVTARKNFLTRRRVRFIIPLRISLVQIRSLLPVC